MDGVVVVLYGAARRQTQTAISMGGMTDWDDDSGQVIAIISLMKYFAENYQEYLNYLHNLFYSIIFTIL